MAQVSLQINGYGYILGCADGEEEHLSALAADLDRRIDDIKASTGPSGEARMLLMAALVLSDELHDLRELAKQGDGDATPASKPEPKGGRRLRGLAKRAEAMADSADGSLLATPADPASTTPADPPSPPLAATPTASPSASPSASLGDASAEPTRRDA
jgi:cell division protein ZapA